jgi:hypothetical protein
MALAGYSPNVRLSLGMVANRLSCFTEMHQTVLHLENDVDAADQDVGRSGGIVAPGVRESFG